MGLQILYERCAGIDIGKDIIAVAVRMPGEGTSTIATSWPSKITQWTRSPSPAQLGRSVLSTYSTKLSSNPSRPLFTEAKSSARPTTIPSSS